jgi:hypothetical protein
MLQICQIDYLSSTKNILDFKAEVTFPPRAFARISLPRQRNYKVPTTRQRKRTTPQVQQSLNTEPNQKDTTKRLAPGGTGTQGRPTCTNYTQIKTSSRLQQGLPQQNEHTNTKKQERYKTSNCSRPTHDIQPTNFSHTEPRWSSLPPASETATAAAPFQSSARRDLGPEDDVAVPHSLRLQLQSPVESSPLHLAALPDI